MTALADGIVRLAADPALRARLGSAARRRVEERFTWTAVAKAHLDLWEELWREPAAPDRETPHPLHLAFAESFAAHPTRTGLAGLSLVCGRAGEALRRGQEHPLIYAGVAHVVTADRVRALLVLARKAVDGKNLCARLMAAEPSLDAESAEFLILWALKHGFLERA